MLPSIGYFKGINCPFFDSGLCERPYCHFRHAKKDTSNPTSSVSVISEEQDPNGLLQKILAESVKKDLQTSGINQSALSLIAFENVPPSSSETSSSVVGEQIPLLEVEKKKAPPKSYAPTTTVTYKPTPIAELKKRHIPIPYSPTLVKSTTVVPKRSSSDVNGAKRIKLDNPVTCDVPWDDQYSPKAFQISPRKSSSQTFEYDPDVSDIQKGVGYSTNTSTSITSSPPSHWHDQDISYKPTPLDQIPIEKPSSPQYEPSECVAEPSYDPVLNMSIGSATYKPSSISQIEPEYRPLGLQKNTKEYHPTDKSKLNTMTTTLSSSESLIITKFDNIVGQDVISDEKKQIKDSPDLGKSSTKEDDTARSSKTDKNIKHSHKHRTHSSHKSTNKSKHEKGKDTETNSNDQNSKGREKESRHNDKKEHSEVKKGHKDSHKKDVHRSSNGTKKSEVSHSHKSRSSSDPVRRRSSESSSDKCRTKSDSSKHKDKKPNGHRKSTVDLKSEKLTHKSHSKKGTRSRSEGSRTNSAKVRSKSSSSKSDKVPDEIGRSKSGSFTDGEKIKSKLDKNLEESCDTVNDNDKNGMSPSSQSDVSSEDDITKECMKIFQEYEPRKVTCLPDPCTKKDEVEHQNLPATTKKRIAHEGAHNVPKPVVATTPKHNVPNPAQVMAERYQKILAAQQSESVSAPQPAPTSTNPSAKVRIAQVQNVQMLLSAKKRLDEMKKKAEQKSAQVAVQQKTVAQSQQKQQSRVAHVPSYEIVTRPRVSSEIGGKVPGHIRQNYFNLLSSEFINFCSSEPEAYQKGLDEEQSIYDRSSSRQVYINLMLLRIHQIRKEGRESLSSEMKNRNLKMVSKSSGNRIVSHTAVLAGKGKGSWSIEKPKKISETPKNAYQDFLKYILKEDELKNNGYPRPHAELKGGAVVYSSYKQNAVCNNPLQRICDRCGKEYQVNKEGIAIKEEECVNHWGRLYNMRISGSWQERYSCCNEGTMAIGCNHSDCHVSSNFDPNNLRGYVKTIPKEEDPPDGDYGVYALDCEMCYTTVGLELTRVTVIDRSLKSVYETLVKPRNPIIDYNTRYSGINADILDPVTTSIYDVQSALLSFISAQTIVIGHSLESDFKALKIIHDTVIDTSVVFPHRRGPPYKRALKTLCSEYLKQSIQNNESGHDSAEDAKACMELMFWKIKQDGG